MGHTCAPCRVRGLLRISGLFCYNMSMPFSQRHDQWVHKGLVNGMFTLHVVPSADGSWGQVEDLPVDVYSCDFELYDPPYGVPPREIFCIRTDAAWWIILTKPVFDQMEQLALDGELSQGFAQAITVINERHIGAWLLVRDKALSSEQALEHMDRRLLETYGQDCAFIKAIMENDQSENPEDLQFDEEDFGREPLEDDILTREPAWDRQETTPNKRIWVNRLATVHTRFRLTQRTKIAGVLALLVAVLILECPRFLHLYQEVYGPPTIDLATCFPHIRWNDRTSDSVMSASHVSRSLFQALSHRNPFKVAGSVVEVSVRDGQRPDESLVYRWKIALDETGTQDEITAEMSRLSGQEMRGLQNTLSGYKSLKFILAFKLFMGWGHHGRFIVILTGLCLAGLGLLIRRVLRRMQAIETDMAVRDAAAHGKILESVAQDTQAAENLMRFNQGRRLQMIEKRSTKSWEQEAFDWVEHHIDRDTGKTKRRQRDARLKGQSKGR